MWGAAKTVTNVRCAAESGKRPANAPGIPCPTSCGTADPLTYVAVVTLLLLAAVAASWIPARRAAALDPVTVLKES